jgi:ornithine cyclodeaminase/alanine dehydrogenase-like protein (mu-crystallin family)
MSDASTKPLADRIGAIIERVKVLADERDACQQESEDLRSRAATDRSEQARLRTALTDAVRELRQEQPS